MKLVTHHLLKHLFGEFATKLLGLGYSGVLEENFCSEGTLKTLYSTMFFLAGGKEKKRKHKGTLNRVDLIKCYDKSETVY